METPQDLIEQLDKWIDSLEPGKSLCLNKEGLFGIKEIVMQLCIEHEEAREARHKAEDQLKYWTRVR